MHPTPRWIRITNSIRDSLLISQPPGLVATRLVLKIPGDVVEPTDLSTQHFLRVDLEKWLPNWARSHDVLFLNIDTRRSAIEFRPATGSDVEVEVEWHQLRSMERADTEG